jgi:hypothetical protein
MQVRWLVIILMVHVLLWIGLKPPVPHSDDRVYVEEGFRLLQPDYHLSESPKSHRFVVIIPVAFWVLLLGNHPFAVSLWPLQCTLLTIAGVFLFLRSYPQWAMLASAMIALNVIQLIYSSVAFPDAVVSLFAFMTVACVALRHEKTQGLGLLAALLLIIGFFAKQIILFILPFLIYVFYTDWKQNRPLVFWKQLTAAGVILTGVVLFFSHLFTGELLFLAHAVEEHHNRVFVNLTASELFRRLTTEPLKFLFWQVGYWPLLLTAWPAFFLHDSRLNFWKTYALILMVTLWAGTTSFHQWSPVPLLDRMWMMWIVPLSILSGYTLMALVRQQLEKKIRLVFYALFIVSALASLIIVHSTRAQLFLFFAVVFFTAERFIYHHFGYRTATLMVLLPFLVLVLWFAVQNSHW